MLPLILPLASCGPERQPDSGIPRPPAEWASYGGDPGGSRYSPLADITPANINRLKPAWTYRTGDIVTGEGEWKGRKSAFEATPLMVDGTLFVATPLNRVIALDPETGKEKWAFDPKIDHDGDYGDGLICRGVSTWVDPERRAGETCRRRLYIATQDARLIAIDAAGGKPCADFGASGEVRLTEGIRIENKGEYHMTSPPAVAGDVVVVGSAINDNNRVEMPSGVVRGYDARSGALKWKWDPIPRDPGDPARTTWEDGGADRTGAANAWGPMAADVERDLIFVPTGSPSPDFFGGMRKGANLYANSVVALRASTGKVVWSFQGVHHDLWDYDLPAQPTLLTVSQGGRTIPAVAQATKMGHLFVLDRETGRPVFPVEERPVPQNGVEGEQLSPTQPFPVVTPPLARNRMTAQEAYGITPWDRGKCREKLASLRNDGIFTPPTIGGSLMYPGNAGGTNWGGLAVDPVRGVIVVNQTNLAFLVRLVPRPQAAEDRRKFPKQEYGAQHGTPYAMRREVPLSPLGMPCSPPPWGTLAGVDVHTGRQLWQVTLGTTRDLAPLGISLKLGTPNVGGPMTTAGGLTFIGAAMDNYLRAFETETGREVWKARLPAGGQATPMSYRVRQGGRQYVVICAGGHGKLGTTLGDYVMAFALD
jgi:quinoprotein glucose dehydrogenase